MRPFVFFGKVVDQALCVGGFIRHHPGKLAPVMRIVDIEPLGDKFSVFVVFGKNNGLAQAVAAGHFLSIGHQMRQHLIDRISIEQPLIQRRRINRIRRGAVLVPFQRIPLLFFIFRQVIVFDALALKLQRHRYRFGWHQMPIRHCFIQSIGIGRHAGFQIKQAIGIAVDLILGRGGQTHQKRIEVFEYGAVFLIHRAMRLVDDN